MDLKIKRKPMWPTQHMMRHHHMKSLDHMRRHYHMRRHHHQLINITPESRASQSHASRVHSRSPYSQFFSDSFQRKNWIFFVESQRQCNAGSQKLNCRGWLFIYKCRPTNQNFTIGRHGSKVFFCTFRETNLFVHNDGPTGCPKL